MTIIWRKSRAGSFERGESYCDRAYSASHQLPTPERNTERSSKLARRLEQLEAEIEELEMQTTELTAAMQETNDASELMELQQKLDQLTEQQEAAMTEWEEVAEQA